MDIAVELSLYPLERDLVPKIKDFIDRLNTHGGVRVITNSLSTQVVGPFDLVFAALDARDPQRPLVRSTSPWWS